MVTRVNDSDAKSRKNGPPAGRLQRGPPGAPPAGPPHQPGGGRGRGEPRPVWASPKPPVHWSGPVYWHMTQPVHTVLARATRAQPYHLPFDPLVYRTYVYRYNYYSRTGTFFRLLSFSSLLLRVYFITPFARQRYVWKINMETLEKAKTPGQPLGRSCDG